MLIGLITLPLAEDLEADNARRNRHLTRLRGGLGEKEELGHECHGSFIHLLVPA